MDLFNVWDHHKAFGKFKDLCASVRLGEDSAQVPAEKAAEYVETLDTLESEANKFQLDAVADFVNFTAFQLHPDRRSPTFHDLRQRLDSVEFLFRTQCAKQVFFRLTKEDSRMYESDSPFGVEVSHAFPSAEVKYEIEEASRCLALGRSTASVFHCMRVLEKGLKALSEAVQVEFSIPFEYLNWQNVIDQVESKIRDLEKQKAGQQKTETLKQYSEAAKQFRYFKDAWRNHVAHSRETYSPEQALSVHRHVGEFMRDLVRLGLSEGPDEGQRSPEGQTPTGII